MTDRRGNRVLLLAIGVGLATAGGAAAPGLAGRADTCLAASGGTRGDLVCIGSLPASEFRVVLKSENGSRERGVAQITFGLHETRVVIRLSGAPREVGQPAHLHEGPCGSSRKIVASLGNVKNGRRRATVDPLPLSYARYAIDIHESAAAGAAVVACGSVPRGH